MEEAIALDSIQAIAASFGASFDAEKIIDTVLEKDGTRYYKVRWVKYSWEPAASFTHLEHLIRAFWSQYAQAPETLDENKRQDAAKILEQANVAQALAQINVDRKSVPSILTSLTNPIVGGMGQVATTPTELQVQHNIQLAGPTFSQLQSVETNTQQHMIPNLQAIPMNVPQEIPPVLPAPSDVNPRVQKVLKPKKPKDPLEPKKRRKIPGTCNICGKHFKSTTNIAAHRKLHTEERQFVCPQCGKKFRRKLHLTRHLESHAGIKSFVCNICGSAFSSKWYMQAHAVVHTGDKPFQCEICEKRFNNKANLSKHKLIHGNKRPFVCNHCGQSYRQSYDLKRHMTIHSQEKSFQCTQCDKSFARKTYLQRHMLTHTSEKKFQCSLCERKFIQRGQLNFHLKQHQAKNKNKHSLMLEDTNSTDDIMFEKETTSEVQLTTDAEEDNKSLEFVEKFQPSSNNATSVDKVSSADDVCESADVFIVPPAMDVNRGASVVPVQTNTTNRTFEILHATKIVDELHNSDQRKQFPVDHNDYFQNTNIKNNPENKHIIQVPVESKSVSETLFSDSNTLKLPTTEQHIEVLPTGTSIKDSSGSFSEVQDNLLVFPHSAENSTNMFL